MDIVRADPKIGLRRLSGVGWTVEILPISSLSILLLEPDPTFGIMGGGLMSVAPKACPLHDAGAFAASGLVKAVGISVFRLRLVVRALWPAVVVEKRRIYWAAAPNFAGDDQLKVCSPGSSPVIGPCCGDGQNGDPRAAANLVAAFPGRLG
uniref:Uncharacterized protein n=1 Tax=Romanomermis culicivorax TaxID=13658 RepID=A0A915HLX3_ROMCU